jgi:hypothetical protein
MTFRHENDLYHIIFLLPDGILGEFALLNNKTFIFTFLMGMRKMARLTLKGFSKKNSANKAAFLPSIK